MMGRIGPKRRAHNEAHPSWKKWDGACVYCGDFADVLDHVHPVARGGTDDPDNLVPACLFCNLSKRIKSVDEFRAWCSRQSGRTFTDVQREFWLSRGVMLPPDEIVAFAFDEGFKEFCQREAAARKAQL